MTTTVRETIRETLRRSTIRTTTLSGGETGLPLIFYALTPDPTTREMVEVRTGTDNYTMTHTATLYAPDFEGFYRVFSVNQTVWTKGRYVSNWIIAYGTAPTYLFDTTFIDEGDGVYLITATLDGARCRFGAPTGGSSRDWFTGRMDVQRVSGAGTIALRINDDIPNQSNIVPTSTMETYGVKGYTTLARRMIDVVFGTAGDSVRVRKVQTENKYSIETNLPSEYVTKWTYFANANGNTIDGNNLVTEAIGADLLEIPRYQYYPAATNGTLYSNNLANATYWFNSIASPVQDQIGLTEAFNTATQLTNTDGADRYIIANYGTAVTPNTKSTVKFWIKKTTAQDIGTLTIIILWNATRAYVAQRAAVTFNPTTGVLGTPGGDVDDPEAEVIDAGDWWILLLSGTDKWSESFMWPQIYPPKIGTSRSITVGNVETHAGKNIDLVRGLGPIFTTTAPVAVDKTEGRLTNTKRMDAAGYIECIPSTQGQAMGGVMSENTYSTGFRYFFSTTSGNWQSSGVILTRTSPKDVLTRVASIQSTASGGNELSVIADGVYQVGATYFSGSDNFIGWSSSYSFQLGEFKLFDIESYLEGKEIIDSLMIDYLTGDSFSDKLRDSDGTPLTV